MNLGTAVILGLIGLTAIYTLYYQVNQWKYELRCRRNRICPTCGRKLEEAE